MSEEFSRMKQQTEWRKELLQEALNLAVRLASEAGLMNQEEKDVLTARLETINSHLTA